MTQGHLLVLQLLAKVEELIFSVSFWQLRILQWMATYLHIFSNKAKTFSIARLLIL
jgi:hypothetical protein